MRNFVRDRCQTDTYTYTNAVDIWSIGVICHEMLTGRRPFVKKQSLIEYYDGIIELPTEYLRENNISDNGIRFTTALLSAQRSTRPSANDALDLAWLNSPSSKANRTLKVDRITQRDLRRTSPTPSSVASMSVISVSSDEGGVAISTLDDESMIVFEHDEETSTSTFEGTINGVFIGPQDDSRKPQTVSEPTVDDSDEVLPSCETVTAVPTTENATLSSRQSIWTSLLNSLNPWSFNSAEINNSKRPQRPATYQPRYPGRDLRRPRFVSESIAVPLDKGVPKYYPKRNRVRINPKKRIRIEGTEPVGLDGDFEYQDFKIRYGFLQ